MTTVKYSEDSTTWVNARNYQIDALNDAISFFENNPGTTKPFEYNKNFITMSIYKSLSSNVYTMIREDKSCAYLKKEMEHYTKMVAPRNGITAEYMGTTINIPAGATYYYNNIEKKIAIGWHGSYNPPCGMDGESIIS